METGDRTTEHRAGEARDEQKVIRLPRDWLGPRDELIPIGPAAEAQALTRGEGPPPAADAFWSEDSAALHDAVQAPATPPPKPVIATESRIPRIRPGLPALGLPAIPPPRWRWALVGLTAVAVAVLAVIGSAETASSPSSSRALSLRRHLAGVFTGPGSAVESSEAKARSIALTRRAASPAGHRNTNAHARAHPRGAQTRRKAHAAVRGSTRRQPSAAAQRSQATATPAEPADETSAASPASIDTAAQSPPATSPAPSEASSGSSATPAPSSPISGSPSSSSASTSHSTSQGSRPAKQPAFGASGSLGPGSSPDG